ncbi:MAG: ABC transporter permease [Firmicutes bacterium HGW-Firmicutes-1]|jgi:NitT/TauT family transport system permease protein|nr:MAG: ABC transporter permease [Firmicutes bacterium HGW-Firmicutes-1]
MIKNSLKNKYIQRSIVVTLLVLLWEALYHLQVFPVQLFPSTSQILKALFVDLLDGKLFVQIGHSLYLIFTGLVIGFIIAVILCYISYFSKLISVLIDTLIAILDPLPGVAILPMIILWIGIGEKAILFIMLHSIIWPMVISIQTGMKNIDRVYIESAKMNAIRNWQLFWYILLPLSLPQILAGIKIGWSRSWRALISSEMIFGAIGAFGGIGWYLFEKRTFMNTPGMFSGLLVIIMISIFVEDIIFVKLDQYIIRSI